MKLAEEARREHAELRRVIPNFAEAGEDMYLRNAHPAGWPILRRVLAPLARDLFPEKKLG